MPRSPLRARREVQAAMLVLFANAAAALVSGYGLSASRSAVLMQAADELVLTPALIEFGCDEALWREVRNKQALLDMAENEAQCRKRIEFLKSVTGDNAAAPRARKRCSRQPHA